MRFCMPHWDVLREAIDKRGLSALVADSGEKAAANLTSEMAGGATIDNFDPLMGAHNAIAANAMRVAAETYQADPLRLMVADPEHPERECPICHLDWLHAEHVEHCQQPGCDYPEGATYDWMIERAADDQVAAWKALGTAGEKA